MIFAPFFALLDEARRGTGQALDAAGFGPIKTPSRIVFDLPGMRLRAYQPDGGPEGPVLLIIPAPIKRAYIWDLLPEVSVVRRCLRHGLRVYLLEWLDTEQAPDHFGLADYTERLPLAALDVIARETGEAAAMLAGHSLGGTFAAVFAALHPDRVSGLVLVDAPLAFGPGQGGPLAHAVTAAPPQVLRSLTAGGSVPGSLTALLSMATVPEVFILQRWVDLGASLRNPLAVAIHVRVERWLLDEFALPGRLFDEVLEQLYREDRLVIGTLEADDRRIGLDRLRSPVLAVVNPSGRVVPPTSILAGIAAMPADLPRRVLCYGQADRGPALQHLGPLVAPAAHATLWPEILNWISTHGLERGHPRTRPGRRKV